MALEDPEIPESLRINNRQPDQDFDDPNERLFRAFPKKDWPVNETNLHLLVDIPQNCTARQRYCENEADVLYTVRLSKSEAVVVPFIVGWIRELDLSGDLAKAIEVSEIFLRIVHCPENDFYPHTEVRTVDSEGSLFVVPGGKKVAKTNRRVLRRLISRCADLEGCSP